MNICFWVWPSLGCDFIEGKNIISVYLCISPAEVAHWQLQDRFVWLRVFVPECFKFELVANI